MGQEKQQTVCDGERRLSHGSRGNEDANVLCSEGLPDENAIMGIHSLGIFSDTAWSQKKDQMRFFMTFCIKVNKGAECSVGMTPTTSKRDCGSSASALIGPLTGAGSPAQQPYFR